VTLGESGYITGTHGWRCDMHCRPHGRKPTIALWMLVAAADLVILVAAAGVLVMSLISVGLAVVVGGVLVERRLTHRAPAAPKAVRRRA
jgi:hypothetical protein